jgi:hypothetical protein
MKRILIAAAAAAMMTGAGFAGSAFAQDQGAAPPPPPPVAQAAPPPATSNCPALPVQPELADGATARNTQVMTEADERFRAWGEAYQEGLVCRRTEVEQLRAQIAELNARNQSLTAQFNAEVQALNDASAAWQAEGAEFNTRQEERQEQRQRRR